MKKRILIFFFIFLFGCLISCNNAPAAHSLKKTENQTAQEGSKKIAKSENTKLASILYELALSPDPEHFAKVAEEILSSKIPFGVNGVKAVYEKYNWANDSKVLIQLYRDLDYV